MIKALRFVMLFTVLTALLPLRSFAQGPGFVSGELYFKLTDTSAVLPDYDAGFTGDYPYLQGAIDSFGIVSITRPFTFLNRHYADRIYSLNFSDTTNFDGLLLSLQSKSIIAYAHFKPIYRLFNNPDDFDTTRNWNLKKIMADSVWLNLSPPANEVKVAVIDDAFNIEHFDLAANIWHNTNEIPDNGIDDDNNGFIDDYMGWDVSSDGGGDNDVMPFPDAEGKLFNHGNHVAGIVAAVANNGFGSTSLGFNKIKIIPIKVGRDTSGVITRPELAAAYAVHIGADVVNMSWGRENYSNPTLQMIIDSSNRNIVWVAAAGNSNHDMNSNTALRTFPACWQRVIAVGSTTRWDRRSPFSNYGDSVDIMAPGSNIYSPVSKNNSAYQITSGTSMAAPLVASVAALMKAYRPDYNTDSVKYYLQISADSIHQENIDYGNKLGAGRLNAWNALRGVQPQYCADFRFADSSSGHMVCLGDVVKLKTLNYSGQNITYRWNFGNGYVEDRSEDSILYQYPTVGIYTIKLTIFNNFTGEILAVSEKTDYVSVVPCTPVQSHKNHWIFGHTAHIDFSSGKPEYKNDIATHPDIAMQLQENSSGFTMSDSAGNLMLYGSGRYNNSIISNTSSGLQENYAPTVFAGRNNSQSWLPIYSRGLYYIFKTGYNYNPSNNSDNPTPLHFYQYNPATETLSSEIYEETGFICQTGEFVTAIGKCDGDTNEWNDDYWILSHGGYDDPLYDYLLIYNFDWDASLQRHKLTIKDTLKKPNGKEIFYGYMKASPDGRYVALTYDLETQNGNTLLTEIYEFDRRNGTMTLKDSVLLGGLEICFSPNSELLYLLTEPGSTVLGNDAPYIIAQVDLKQPDISKNIKSFSSEGPSYVMAMGPDDRIYIGNYEFPDMSAISFPNERIKTGKLNNIGLYYNAIEIKSPSLVKQGVVNFVDAKSAHFFRKEFKEIITGCRSRRFEYNYGCGDYKFFWNFGDLTTSADTSNLQYPPAYQYPDSGTYVVSLILIDSMTMTHLDTLRDTIRIQSPPTPVLKNIYNRTTICTGEEILLKDSLGDEDNLYKWILDEVELTGDTLPVLRIKFPYQNPVVKRFKAVATDYLGCISDTGYLNLNYFSNDTALTSGTNFLACHTTLQATLMAPISQPFLQYQWQIDTGDGVFHTSIQGGHDTFLYAQFSGRYRFIVHDNLKGCSDTSFAKWVLPQGNPQIYLSRGYYLPTLADTVRLIPDSANQIYTNHVWMLENDTLYPQSTDYTKSHAPRTGNYRILMLGPCGYDTSNVVTSRGACDAIHYTGTLQFGGLCPPGNYNSALGYYINNTLTIGTFTTVNFNLTSLIMGPCAEIVIEPGGTLNINRTTITSCENWKGIKILADSNAPPPNTGKLSMRRSSLSFANVAVHSYGGGEFNIDTCIFTDNNMHIAMTDYDSSKSVIGQITHSRFYTRRYGEAPCTDDRDFIDTVKLVSLSGDSVSWMPDLFFQDAKAIWLYRNKFQPGSAISFIPSNEFTYHLPGKVSVLAHRTQGLNLELDTFASTTFHAAAFYQSGANNIENCLFRLDNSTFHATGTINGIYGENMSNALIKSNRFKNLSTSIELYGSEEDTNTIQSNRFSNSALALVVAPEQWPYDSDDTTINAGNDTQRVNIFCNLFENCGNAITVAGRIIKQGDSVYGAENEFDATISWNIYHDNRMGSDTPWYYWHDTLTNNPLHDDYYDPIKLFKINGKFPDTLYRIDDTAVTANSCYPYPSASMAGPASVKDNKKETEQKDRYLLYPNPAKNSVIIKYLGEAGEVFRAELFDLTGRKLLEAEANGQTEMHLGILAPGAYFVRISNAENNIQVFKLIKE